jgi:3-dehydroquinate synthase
VSTLSTTPGCAARVRVELGPRSYDVYVVSGGGAGFGTFARSSLDATWGGRHCRKALMVTDENVSALEAPFLSALEEAGICTTVAVMPAGEHSKSIHRASDLYDELVKLRADRHTAIVALGGGVIGDLAGFVAATYARGLPLLMIPTTLLAQVDSSVGGKVGVNHPRAKNVIGAFHQPVGVWIDTETLRTLSDREYRCGLAEVIKYGVILDADFFAFLEQNAEAILAREPRALCHMVAHSCRLKADVVSKDEREETGLRAVLNFGHTIGHAIESVSGYGAHYHHGEAVAVGMVAEGQLAARIGWVPDDLAVRIRRLVERFGLPASAGELNPDAMLDAMSRDKKNLKGRIRFVLPRAIGRVELTDAPTADEVRAVL